MIRTLHFNGTDNYITLGDQSNAQALVTRSFTIECWVKETLAQEWTCFVGAVTDKGDIEKGWMLGITFDRRFTFGLVTEDSDGITYLKAPQSYAPGVWHHLAGVYDGSEMRLYVDGALVNTATGITGDVVFPAAGTFAVGAFKDVYDFYPYAGYLSDMRLWNVVRSGTEISDNHTLRLDISLQTGLVGYWPLDDAAGTTARDWAETTTGTVMGGEPNWESQADLTLAGYSPAPPAPEILPAENITDSGFTAAWNAVPDVTDYYIDVATDNAFAAVLPAYDNKHVTGLSTVIDGLENETDYFWRVRSENTNGTSLNSTVGSVTTLIATIPTSNFAVNLANSGDFLQVAKVDVMEPLVTQNLTAEVWVRPDLLQAINGYLGVIEDSTDEKKGWLLGSIANKFSFGVSGSTTTGAGATGIITWVSQDTEYTVGEWYHVAGTYDGTTMNLYVNGELVATDTVATGSISYPTLPDPPESNTANFVIGAYLDSGAFHSFRGMIAEACMWSKALTQQEIQDRMDYRADDFATQPDLKGYWPMDKGLGTSATELSNGNNGTFQSSAAWNDAGALSLFRMMDDISQTSSGMSHNLALKEDGTVWAWGSNHSGQLGDGTNIQRVSPVLVEDAAGNYLQGFTQVSAGFFHSLGLKDDGTVWAWGHNYHSQLGIDGVEFRTHAAQVPGLVNITAIETRSNFNLALKNDGTVWAWGRNEKGQLGDGTTTNSFTPVQVQAQTTSGYLENIVAIAAGHQHGVVLLQDETVMTWGANDFHQLGDGTTTDRAIADRLKDQTDTVITGIIGIDAGLSHTLALEKINNNILAWGNNDFGQLGDSAATGERPSLVKNESDIPINGIQNISAGYHHGMAWKADNSALIWGRNDRGQLGDGTVVDNPVPQTVVGEDQNPVTVLSISAGHSHTTALISDNTVFSWGLNTSGQLGNGSTELRDISQIDFSFQTAFAVKKDGTAWAWGFNHDTYYSLGMGHTQELNTPTQMKGINNTGNLENVKTISTLHWNGLALFEDGQVCSWGQNDYGQCGNGTTTTLQYPHYVKDENNTSTLTDIIDIAAGYQHSIALKNDNTIRTWGDNSSGELGIGNSTQSTYPVWPTITDVQAISAGTGFSVALKTDGTVWSWGSPSHVLGRDHNIVSHQIPGQVQGMNGTGVLEEIIAISTGYHHTLALNDDGTVWTWGTNDKGQLGNNSTVNTGQPVQVLRPDGGGLLQEIIAINAGFYHSMALRQDGTIFAWGYNNSGQLGNNPSGSKPYPNQLAPVPVEYATAQGILGRIVALGCGLESSYALDEDGSLWAWGSNGVGELGVGDIAPGGSLVPLRILTF